MAEARMVDHLLRAIRGLLVIIRALSGLLLICSVILNFVNIVGRYFLHASIPWAEEVMLFLMVGCVFLSSGIVAWSGRHIRMDVVVHMMPEKIRDLLALLSELALLAASVVLAVFAWPVIQQLVAFDQRSMAANIPLAIPQAMLPVGLLIMAFIVAGRLLAGRSGDASGESKL